MRARKNGACRRVARRACLCRLLHDCRRRYCDVDLRGLRDHPDRGAAGETLVLLEDVGRSPVDAKLAGVAAVLLPG